MTLKCQKKGRAKVALLNMNTKYNWRISDMLNRF